MLAASHFELALDSMKAKYGDPFGPPTRSLKTSSHCWTSEPHADYYFSISVATAIFKCGTPTGAGNLYRRLARMLRILLLQTVSANRPYSPSSSQGFPPQPPTFLTRFPSPIARTSLSGLRRKRESSLPPLMGTSLDPGVSTSIGPIKFGITTSRPLTHWRSSHFARLSCLEIMAQWSTNGRENWDAQHSYLS